jgi:hypothetical protein
MTDDLDRFRWGFRRSRKGNLWQLLEGRLLTVFRRHGRYVFYMAECWTPDGPIPPGVSEDTYATEAEGPGGPGGGSRRGPSRQDVGREEGVCLVAIGTGGTVAP